MESLKIKEKAKENETCKIGWIIKFIYKLGYFTQLNKIHTSK